MNPIEYDLKKTGFEITGAVPDDLPEQPLSHEGKSMNSCLENNGQPSYGGNQAGSEKPGHKKDP